MKKLLIYFKVRIVILGLREMVKNDFIMKAFNTALLKTIDEELGPKKHPKIYGHKYPYYGGKES